MLGSSLGFNTNTKKSEIGDYFKKIQNTLEGTKTSLNKIVENMKKEGNPNATAVENAVKTLVAGTLDKVIEGAKTASGAIGDAGRPIANVAEQDAGAVGDVDNLVKGIKGIVNVVLKEGDADAGDANGPVNDNGSAGDVRTNSSDNAGKLFASDNSGNATSVAAKAAKDAIKAVGAITGADILQAISKGVGGKAVALAKNTDAVGSVSAAQDAKDATIAGAIALRAMAKNGKFSGPPQSTPKKDVATQLKELHSVQ